MTGFFKAKSASMLDSTTVLEETIVTATKTSRKLGNLTVPVVLINRQTILQTGNLKLNDILREQAGLNIVSYFGDAVQMQGLSGDYTLILINGEPLVGRSSGTLDLSRISVANIKKIEIVKGPSSSLYGSEALAGVINIITETNPQKNLQAFVRFGNYNQIQTNILGSVSSKKLFYTGSADVNRYDGYSVRPYSLERVINPIYRFTTQNELKYVVSNTSQFNVQFRYNYNKIINTIETINLNETTKADGSEEQNDLNTQLNWHKKINNAWKTVLRTYYTDFSTMQHLSNSDSSQYLDQFNQNFWRLENQTNYSHKNIDLTLGTGNIIERVITNRYGPTSVNKENDIQYIFGQLEWDIRPIWKIIIGTRYDHNSLYASAFSPKFSTLINLSKFVNLKFSIGRGFKAPDFRQLYLDFTNTAAGGYSIYGANTAVQTIQYLLASDQISSTTENFALLKNLVPETSTGMNFGLGWNYNAQFNVQVNFFYNNIDNFIDSRVVAYKSNGSQIFSYVNVRKVFTYGSEISVFKEFKFGLSLELGYQYLQTGDIDQIEQIKKGLVFTRIYQNNHLYTESINLSNYLGLPYRSPHQATVKVNYRHKSQFFANVRVIYRSPWAFDDNNGNGVYDTYDQLAPENYLVNLAIGKTWKKNYTLQGGINNLTNFTDPIRQPSLLGINYYLTFTYNINFKK